MTPYLYNSTETSWDSVKNHLLGICDNSNLSLNMANLYKKIRAISETHVSSATAPKVANSFLATLRPYTTHTAWFPFFMNFRMSALIILSLLLLFPVFIQLLSKRI